MRPDNMIETRLDQFCLDGTQWMNNDSQKDTKHKKGEGK